MKHLFLLIVLVFSMVIGLPAQARTMKLVTFQKLPESSPEQVTTRAGLLKVTRSTPQSTPDSITLNGKTVFKAQDEYVSIQRLFKLPSYDAVLISTNCGGSGCTYDGFSFLLVDGKRVVTVSHKDFVAISGEVKTRQQGDKVLLELGFEEKKRKVAVLNGKKVTVQTVAAPKQALREDFCQWLHKDALDACVYARHEDTQCANPQATFGGAVMRGVNAAGDHPGFDANQFSKACVAACKTGKADRYVSFGRLVCSK